MSGVKKALPMSGGAFSENENITMDIWKDTGQKDNFVGMGQKTGCAIGKTFGIFPLTS